MTYWMHYACLNIGILEFTLDFCTLGTSYDSFFLSYDFFKLWFKLWKKKHSCSCYFVHVKQSCCSYSQFSQNLTQCLYCPSPLSCKSTPNEYTSHAKVVPFRFYCLARFLICRNSTSELKLQVKYQ